LTFASDAELVERFVHDGFVAIRGAVAPDVVAACRDVIWTALAAENGVHEHDRSTWTMPVVRRNCPEGGSFVDAGTAPALFRVYDLLLGPGRWRRRAGVGGTIPVRFPSEVDPGDAGWHIDGSYDVDGTWWVNVHSRGRGLLALFLFTDVTPADAPTRVLVGSHLDVPPVLLPAGERGMPFSAVARSLPPRTFERDVALVTGKAGDVFVCHPFLVHAATWPHRGGAARMLAQPEIALLEPFTLASEAEACPVERAILRGLLAK
jgi:hypothetical protein